MLQKFLLVILFQIGLCALKRLQCKDEYMKDLDWFAVYKIPRNASSYPINEQIKAGVAYWTASPDHFRFNFARNITSSDSSLANTLAPLYDNEITNPEFWMMYNDQPPDGNTFSNLGHSKGVVLVNKDEGIWLVHSIPHFPPMPTQSAKFKYPDTGLHYGQNALCISINKEEFDNIGLQLMYNEVHVYAKYSVGSEISKLYPHLYAAANEERVNASTNFRETIIRSKSGYLFRSFAKTAAWNKDLYADLVAPALNKSLYTETWMNEADKLSSTCNTTNPVMNIKTMSFNHDIRIWFKSTQDHSKLAIQADSDDKGNWICIGDINRTQSQFKRGGGTVCQKNLLFWQYYRGLVFDVDDCPKK